MVTIETIYTQVKYPKNISLSGLSMAKSEQPNPSNTSLRTQSCCIPLTPAAVGTSFISRLTSFQRSFTNAFNTQGSQTTLNRHEPLKVEEHLACQTPAYSMEAFTWPGSIPFLLRAMLSFSGQFCISTTSWTRGYRPQLLFLFERS